MPCDSSHLEPTAREIESKLVCTLLCYLFKALGRSTPPDVRAASKHVYGDEKLLDHHTAMLCAECKKLEDSVHADSILYDGKNPQARRLADWWDRHKLADERRIAAEKSKRQRTDIRKRALKKLTAAERRAFGL